MGRKSDSRKKGNGARARRQERCTQRLAAAKGISVEMPCPVLVIGTMGAGKTASVVLPRLATLPSLGAAGRPARVKGTGEGQ